VDFLIVLFVFYNNTNIATILTNKQIIETIFTNIKERVLKISDYKGISKEKFFNELVLFIKSHLGINWKKSHHY